MNREGLDMATRPGQDQTNASKLANREGRGFLRVFFILFTLFTLNVLLGKANIQFGWNLPFLLGDVPEFLLLLTAALFLMLAALKREKGQSGD
ncbi:MAG: hypothetical protein OEZ03_06220 [Alphaproteobacteria bacterium]|nr:hypothetical protein [Alphaproteobacteria bacterium]